MSTWEELIIGPNPCGECGGDHGEHVAGCSFAASTGSAAHPSCADCGKPYTDFPLDVHLPRSQWLKIAPSPDGGGLLCVACIVERASKLPFVTVAHMILEVGAQAPVAAKAMAELRQIVRDRKHKAAQRAENCRRNGQTHNEAFNAGEAAALRELLQEVNRITAAMAFGGNVSLSDQGSAHE